MLKEENNIKMNFMKKEVPPVNLVYIICLKQKALAIGRSAPTQRCNKLTTASKDAPTKDTKQ